MKAKVKTTGKIIDVRVHGTNANGKSISFYSLDGRDYFKAEDLELESEKYETQDEWNAIYKSIETLCERITPQTVKNDAHYNALWSDVYKHLDKARGMLSADKYDYHWEETI